MKNKTKETQTESAAFTDAELDQLLASVEEVVVKEEPVVVEEVKEVIKSTPVEVVPEKMKAYNVFKADNGMYMLDTIEYDNDTFKLTRKNLTASQAVAMFEIKKLFTNKLILKRENK